MNTTLTLTELESRETPTALPVPPGPVPPTPVDDPAIKEIEVGYVCRLPVIPPIQPGE